MVKIEYANISFDDLRGDHLADFLIAIDADMTISDNGRIIYEEPSFPVVELARELTIWLAGGLQDSLVFTSMSSDQEGIVTLAREASDWRIFSSFSPEASTRALSRGEVQQCAGRFIADVRRDLAARHLDANSILGGPHP